MLDLLIFISFSIISCVDYFFFFCLVDLSQHSVCWYSRFEPFSSISCFFLFGVFGIRFYKKCDGIRLLKMNDKCNFVHSCVHTLQRGKKNHIQTKSKLHRKQVVGLPMSWPAIRKFCIYFFSTALYLDISISTLFKYIVTR